MKYLVFFPIFLKTCQVQIRLVCSSCSVVSVTGALHYLAILRTLGQSEWLSLDQETQDHTSGPDSPSLQDEGKSGRKQVPPLSSSLIFKKLIDYLISSWFSVYSQNLDKASG
jgi:hypothetical protein